MARKEKEGEDSLGRGSRAQVVPPTEPTLSLPPSDHSTLFYSPFRLLFSIVITKPIVKGLAPRKERNAERNGASGNSVITTNHAKHSRHFPDKNKLTFSGGYRAASCLAKRGDLTYSATTT